MEPKIYIYIYKKQAKLQEKILSVGVEPTQNIYSLTRSYYLSKQLRA